MLLLLGCGPAPEKPYDVRDTAETGSVWDVSDSDADSDTHGGDDTGCGAQGETLVIDGDDAAEEIAALCGCNGWEDSEVWVEATPLTTLTELSCLGSLRSIDVLDNPLLTTLGVEANAIALENNPLFRTWAISGATRDLDLVGNGIPTLEGLPESDWLTLQGEDQLVSLSGVRVNGLLDISGCDQISSLDGLESETLGTLYLRSDAALTSAALPESILEMDGVLLSDLPALTRLELEGLGYVRTVEISSVGLDDLSGLPRTMFSLRLEGDTPLTDLRGIPEGTEIASFAIDGLPLTSLDGAESLSADVVTVGNLDGLVSLAGLPSGASVGVTGGGVAELGLTAPVASLWVSNTPFLTTLGSLGGTTTLDEFEFTSCPALEDLAGAEAVEEIGTLTLSDLPNLRSLRGLAALRETTDVTLVGLDALESLEGPTWGVTGLLDLEQTPLVSDLSPLGGVTELDTLALRDLESLGTLDGLESLETIGGGLYITGNVSLTDISALSHLRSIGFVYILDNPQLSAADIDAVLDAVGRENIGEVVAYDNGP